MKVNLPEPCHEDWNKMDAKEKGRFCGSCEKLVIDFSKMSDTQIISYFKQYKGQSTCGHFKKTQIDRTLKEQDTPRRKLFLKELAAACFAFFLASTDAKSQNETNINQQHQSQETKNSTPNEGREIAINGKVKNGNEGLSNAIISIKGTSHKTYSSSNGIFSIHIPSTFSKNQNFITLVVEHKDFTTKEISVATSPTNQFVEIDFVEDNRTFKKSVAISGTITGTVKDDTGETLPSATVVIKGTTRGTITDFDGNYSLVIPDNQEVTLIYSFVGFDSKEITVDTQTVIDVTLNTGVLEGMFVVGGYYESSYKWYTLRSLWRRVKSIFR